MDQNRSKKWLTLRNPNSWLKKARLKDSMVPQRRSRTEYFIQDGTPGAECTKILKVQNMKAGCESCIQRMTYQILVYSNICADKAYVRTQNQNEPNMLENDSCNDAFHLYSEDKFHSLPTKTSTETTFKVKFTT